MTPTDKEIETFIRQALNQNYELLRLESGHALSADVKETALQQALLYWRKLKEVANRVTETEVPLNLPGQTSPQGRPFGIEGVVDIVREDEKTIMYDIKTHEADYVRQNLPDYEEQLDIYAHIWQNLRGQPLDETAIIATAYPDGVKDALASRDPARLEWELSLWDPLVPIQPNPEHVDAIVADYGRVVDRIESGEFAPAPLEVLLGRREDRERAFASRVCRRCDARFSCDSYRRYAETAGGRPEQVLRQYLTDYGSDVDQQDWLSNSLATGQSQNTIE
jgi:hypothetical protein